MWKFLTVSYKTTNRDSLIPYSQNDILLLCDNEELFVCESFQQLTYKKAFFKWY